MEKLTENRLDEDFLFFLGLAKSSFPIIKNTRDIKKCQEWLNKLCGGFYKGLVAKKNRNIFLSNLILCMQDNMLTGPFLNYPNDEDLANATAVFTPLQYPLEQDVNLNNTDIELSDIQHTSGDGRTYLATRVLPDGSGAFGYLAVSVGDGEQQWYNQRQLSGLSEKYKMALKRRKSPITREKILTFYDGLMENIREELDGLVSPNLNEQINKLLEKLEECLRERGLFQQYESLSRKDLRIELMLLLYEKMRVRRQRVVEREHLLEQVESSFFPESFWNVSARTASHSLPTAMWEQSINAPPNEYNLELLAEAYPNELIEKFLELLVSQKEIIAVRTQKRHENIVIQMKKELLHGGEVHKIKYDEIKLIYDEVRYILDELNVAKERQKVTRNTLEINSGANEALNRVQADIEKTQRRNEEYADQGNKLSTEITALRDTRAEIAQEGAQIAKNYAQTNGRLRKEVDQLWIQVRNAEKMLKNKHLDISGNDEEVNYGQSPCGLRKCSAARK